MTGAPAPDVVVVVPVYGNAATLRPLVTRLGVVLGDRRWRVRLVIDASPDASAQVARSLVDSRVAVTELSRNVGQHAALAIGLAAEPAGAAWVCMDADLQDPPEAVPALLAALPGQAAVFAGRRGRYEPAVRLRTGRLHRRLMSRLTGLPADAGAFVALDSRGREAILLGRAPSVVAALAVSGLPLGSIPVERAARAEGSSAWTARRRLSQSLRTLAWVVRHRSRSVAR
ncbi:MAG TPA: glycosyltransferase [Mycobacteriales bacterium]|nr:glycosyltransferase [Mycobacteriales bacterium]